MKQSNELTNVNGKWYWGYQDTKMEPDIRVQGHSIGSLCLFQHGVALLPALFLIRKKLFKILSGKHIKITFIWKLLSTCRLNCIPTLKGNWFHCVSTRDQVRGRVAVKQVWCADYLREKRSQAWRSWRWGGEQGLLGPDSGLQPLRDMERLCAFDRDGAVQRHRKVCPKNCVNIVRGMLGQKHSVGYSKDENQVRMASELPWVNSHL